MNLFCFAIDQSLQTISRSLASYTDIQDIHTRYTDIQDTQDIQEYNTQGISYQLGT